MHQKTEMEVINTSKMDQTKAEYIPIMIRMAEKESKSGRILPKVEGLARMRLHQDKVNIHNTLHVTFSLSECTLG